MTGYQLAQVNVGHIVAPLESPELADFVANLPEINALADGSPGFVWRMVDEGGADNTMLRPDSADRLLLLNCSVWESLAALRAYVYQSAHLRVLSRRREWFVRHVEAHQALWWVPAGHRPTVPEATARLALLRELGPTQRAFTFREPFPAPSGEPAPTA
ncbi:DUF3291 domain-containing protein [Phaeacidiphilus oryzae]|uniref:DUF3291 domain-containing protein n=1 Tax=Phaeacidiphilus oryzae TaxID=348818 RepID=UPI000564822B|nr:DUF3291 domain-containing protein [Phaeacidiphilus oryzae]